ncbi:MAG: dTDP-4-dehydrorhamnose 3,5-epimerase [Flavobacteriaceae bacterium]
MIFEPTEFTGVFVGTPTVYKDARGYFLESYRLNELPFSANFVQENESSSCFGTLRGLHFQTGEFAQAKLVRVVQGRILDVIVDLRKDSTTYLKHFSIELDDSSKQSLFVPRGFAHGFVVLSERAIVSYKADNYYKPESESGIHYDDPLLNIDWRLEKNELIISDKDKLLPFLNV